MKMRVACRHHGGRSAVPLGGRPRDVVWRRKVDLHSPRAGAALVTPPATRNSTTGTEMSENADALDRLVERAGQLYSLPTVAMKVLDLTDDPRTDVPALKACLENDPALTGKILRVVNSSVFGFSREISDLNQALALLGTKPLRLLVLGFSLPEGLFEHVEADVLSRYWRHTLTCAAAARQLAGCLHYPSPDEAFTAGLLRNLGLLVLVQQLGATFCSFLTTLYAKRADIPAWEERALGFHHVQLTARLLERWALPQVLVDAVRLSIEPPDGAATAAAPAVRLACIVWLAGCLAEALVGGNQQAFGRLLARAAMLGIGLEQLEQQVSVLKEKVDQLGEILSVPLSKHDDYVELLRRAHRRLSETAAEVACELLVAEQPGSAASAAGQALSEQCQTLGSAFAQTVRSWDGPSAAEPGEKTLSAATARRQASAAKPNDRGGSNNPLLAATLEGAGGAASHTDHRPATRCRADSIDPGILGRIGAAVAGCRQSRRPLTLMLAELHDMENLLVLHGVEGLGRLRHLLEECCWSLDHPFLECVPHRDCGFLLILPDCDRQPGVVLGQQLLRQFKQLAPAANGAGRPAVVVSVGSATVSMPPKSFPAADLLKAAERCLFGAHSSGGNVVKSIEIF